MVPSTWVSVVFFLLLLAPGLLFDLLGERRRAGPSESAFREAGRVVLASLVFTGVGLAVVAAARGTLPALTPDPGALLDDPHRYVVKHYGLVSGALVLEFATAMGTVALVHWRLARRQGGASLRSGSGWVYALRRFAPADARPYVRVRLTNGTIYQGRVAHYTADVEIGDRELVLAPPLFSNTESDAVAAVAAEWQRIVLRGSDIESMAVRYETGD